MKEGFSIEDLFIKIIPGGFLIGVLYFLYSDKIPLKIDAGLDFFYTFLFFTFAYLTGEVIQTISNELKRLIYIFFKFYQPSEIFLYKNNPIIKSEHNREDVIKELKLNEEDIIFYNTEYKDLPWFFGKTDSNCKCNISFWKLYTKVSNTEEVKAFNRGFLLVRGITFTLLSLSIIFLVKKIFILSIISFVLFLLFLWRARGMARTLIFKTVMLNLKN